MTSERAVVIVILAVNMTTQLPRIESDTLPVLELLLQLVSSVRVYGPCTRHDMTCG